MTQQQREASEFRAGRSHGRLQAFGLGAAGDLIASSAQEAHQLDLEDRQRESRSARIANYVTAKLGSMGFMLLNLVWFVVWIAVNLPGSRWQFDPFPFSFLTMAVSLEAIALSVFVLISENAQARRADRRARVDMQVNVIAEREITALVKLVAEIHEHLGLKPPADEVVKEMAADTPLAEVARSVDDDEDDEGDEDEDHKDEDHEETPAREQAEARA